jgi:NodT family efflux transporter outer membrane factor (OMF) lipoprotein
MVRGIAVALCLGLGACTVGPDYVRPAAPVPAAYKWQQSGREAAQGEIGWREARPADASERGAWWWMFDDPVLDSLLRQVDVSNQNVAAAEAAFRNAAAAVAEARAAFFPTVDLNASAQRARAGASRPSGPGGANRSGSIGNLFTTTGSASWIPDLWGRIGLSVTGAAATAQASAADLAAARLAAQSQLATAYIKIRVLDELRRLLDAAVDAYTESLRITRNQFNAGIVSASDVAQAQTQLESTRARAVATAVARAPLENAIAALIGRPPAALSIAPVPGLPPLPEIPPSLPSSLLERRPDIAAAERRMAAANADIGIAATAFYPDITLSAVAGASATTLAGLASAAGRLWSVGATLAQTVFDAGARQAQLERALATYDRDVALYRQTVLDGLREVEDQLSALQILKDQLAAQEKAVAAAREAERILRNRYLAGTVSFTDVVVAQAAALANAQTALDVRQAQLLAAVALIEALGGGWDSAQLPSRDRLDALAPLDFSPLPPPVGWPRPLP